LHLESVLNQALRGKNVEKIELSNKKFIDSESEVTGVKPTKTRAKHRKNTKVTYRFLIALFADVLKIRVTRLLLRCKKRSL